MIYHVSIPSADPRRTAKALGEILGGKAVRFVPSGAEAYMVYAGKDSASGVLVEVLPETARHTPGPNPGDRMGYSYDQPTPREGVARFNVAHIAMSTDVAPDTIKAVAEREGWRMTPFWRGRQFPVLELWVENRFMFELLTPEGVGHYAQNMTPEKWIGAFGLIERDGLYELPEQPNELARMVLASVRPAN